MESTPDSGVEIKKAVTAPLLAPCFFKVAAAGNTPQEHSGMGIPRIAALTVDINFPLPRCLAMDAGFKNTFNRPATRIPKST